MLRMYVDHVPMVVRMARNNFGFLLCLRKFLIFTKHLFLQIQQIWLSVHSWTFAPSEPIVTMNINAPSLFFQLTNTIHTTLLT